MEEGDIITIETKDGIQIDAEIVRISCPACGEEFIGCKRSAGGFIAGHQAYHEFTNAHDMIINNMGGV